MDKRRRPQVILAEVHTFCYHILESIDDGEVLLKAHLKNEAVPLVTFAGNLLGSKIEDRANVDVDSLHSLLAVLQRLSEVIWHLRIRSKKSQDDEEKINLKKSLKTVLLTLELPKLHAQLIAHLSELHQAMDNANFFQDAAQFSETFLSSRLSNADDEAEDVNLLIAQITTALSTLNSNPLLEKPIMKQLGKMWELKKPQKLAAKLFAKKWDAPAQNIVQAVELALLEVCARELGENQIKLDDRNVILEGSFGNLHLCAGSVLGESVAFYPLTREVLSNFSSSGRGQMTSELLQERWAKKFNHPGIIKFYGTLMSATNNTIQYFVIERMPTNLSVFMHGTEIPSYKAAMRLTSDDISSVARGISDGLNFLHSNQVVHRDLRPINVFLSDGSRNVKLGGFGTDSLVDDISYYAPEVLSNNPEWTFASDMFAYAVILWEMTQPNKRPWDGKPPAKEALYKRLVDENERPEFFDDSVLLSWLEKLIEECWQSKPWLRPRAKEVLAFLNSKLKYGDAETRKRDVLGKSLKFVEKFKSISTPRNSGPHGANPNPTPTPQANRQSSEPGGKKRRSTMRQSLTRLPSNIRTSTRQHNFLDRVTTTTDISVAYKVVRFMELSLKEEETQARCCRAVKTFALNKENEKALVEMGAGNAVLNALRAFPESADISESTCGAICNLCFYDQGSKALMQRGAMPLVLGVLKRHRDNPEVLIEAVQALVNLIHDQYDRKKAFLKFKAGELIVDIMRKYDSVPRLQEECCAAIVTLQDAFADGGFYSLNAHVIILDVLEKSPNIPSLQAMAFDALRTMSTTPSGASKAERNAALERKRELCNLNTQEHLKNALTNNIYDEDLVDKCLGLITSLAFNENNIAQMMNLGIGQLVLDAMGTFEGDPDIQLRGLWAIGYLVYGKKKWKSKVPKENRFDKKATIAAITTALKLHTRDENLQTKGKEVMKQMKSY